ncbi:MAG: metallophosphoesterase [Zestosphaera sp.]
MSSVRICAVGDVHGKRYLQIFQASLRSMVSFRPDVCVFAGDMVDDGRAEELDIVVNEVKTKFPNTPIVAVFGNEEYHEYEDIFMSRYPELMWLNDSMSILDVRGVKIAFIGSRGSLDRRTYWQKRNKPELRLIYAERPKILRSLINEARKHADIVTLVTHYAPAFLTVRGEPERVYPFMGSQLMERMIRESKPELVIHAHAHNARVLEAVLGSIRIYNVSLPARRNVTQIEFPLRKILSDSRTSPQA